MVKSQREFSFSSHHSQSIFLALWKKLMNSNLVNFLWRWNNIESIFWDLAIFTSSCMSRRVAAVQNGGMGSGTAVPCTENSKADWPCNQVDFWQSRPEKYEEAKNKNASSLGLFLADRTRGASSDPPAPSHFSSLADGHLEFIFQSAARTYGIRRHHTLHIAQS